MEMFETQQTAGQNAYVSLANKYRPQTFEEVVGQGSVSKTLVNALKSGRIAHAYLFYGPRGCGKTTSARIFAKALNCTGSGEDKPTAAPCGKCPQCVEISNSSDMDVLELDAASNTGVDKVREAIIDTVALSSGRDRYKVFILDEVHMLSSSAFNALLKTIEEPPPHVVFILATTELHKVPPTISSRCQTFRFKPITEGEIVAHLQDLSGAENIELDEEAAKIIAKAAGGALRDALTIFDRAIAFSGGKINKDAVSEMLGLLPQDLIKNAATAIVKNDGAALHEVFETVAKEGFDALSLLKDLKNAFGEIFYFSLNAGSEPFSGAKDILTETSPAFIASLTRKISKLIDEVKFSDTALLSAEVGLFTIMGGTFDIEGFIARLEALEGGESSPKASGGNAEPDKKKILAEKQKTAKPKPEEIKIVLEPDCAPKILQDNSDIWAGFKAELAKKHPFLHDILQDAAPFFAPQDKWILKFKSKDSYFKDTVKNRVEDLQGVALKITGKNIRFDFTIEENATRFEQPVSATSFKQNAKPAPVQNAQSGQEIISKEIPFLEGDYSAFLQPQEPQNKLPAAGEIGETTKKILNIFDGYMTEVV